MKEVTGDLLADIDREVATARARYRAEHGHLDEEDEPDAEEEVTPNLASTSPGNTTSGAGPSNASTDVAPATVPDSPPILRRSRRQRIDRLLSIQAYADLRTFEAACDDYCLTSLTAPA